MFLKLHIFEGFTQSRIHKNTLAKTENNVVPMPGLVWHREFTLYFKEAVACHANLAPLRTEQRPIMKRQCGFKGSVELVLRVSFEHKALNGTCQG